MLRLLTPWLGSFKWYRKLVGGTWHKVIDRQDVTAWHSPTAHWVNYPVGDSLEIIATEKY